MKKRWKVFWITCAVSGILGIALLLVSVAMGVTFQKVESMMPMGISIGTFEEESNEVHEEVEEKKIPDTRDSYEGILALDIDLKAGDLEILTSYSDNVEIKTESISKKLKLNYSRKGNTLVVDSTENLKGIVNSNFGTVCIYLPEGMHLEDVKISVGAGALYVEAINAEDLSVDVGAGTADIESFIAKRADFDCGAGEMTIYGMVERELDIDCGMGSVNYYTSDREEDYDYKLNCGVGEIRCGSNSYSGIGSEQKVENHHASKKMDIDCGLGEVTVEFEGGR